MVKRVTTSKKRVSKDLSDLETRRQAVRERRRLAKKQAKEARKLLKQAKKVAKRAKAELQSLSKKLKKLLSGSGRKPTARKTRRSRAVKRSKTAATKRG